METKLYKESENAFVKIDDSWIKVSSVEAARPLGGRTRVYLSSGNFIDVHVTPDDVMQYIVKAQTRP